VQEASRTATSLKPKVDAGTLIQVIKEITKECEHATKVLDEAAKMPGPKEEAAKVKEHAQAMLRSDVTEIENAVFARRSLGRADVEAAQRYYTAPDTHDVGVLTAARSLKRLLGRRLLTKGSALQALIAAHEQQTEAAEDILTEALEKAGGNPQSQRFQMALASRSSQVLDDACMGECGVNSSDLMSWAAAEGQKDAKFAAALHGLQQTYSSKLDAAFNNAIHALMQGGAMGM